MFKLETKLGLGKLNYYFFSNLLILNILVAATKFFINSIYLDFIFVTIFSIFVFSQSAILVFRLVKKRDDTNLYDKNTFDLLLIIMFSFSIYLIAILGINEEVVFFATDLSSVISGTISILFNSIFILSATQYSIFIVLYFVFKSKTTQTKQNGH